MRCHFTCGMTRTKKKKERKTTSVGEVVEKLECSVIASGNVKLCSCCEKQFDCSSKQLNIELPYDPTIPLLGIYPKVLDTCAQTRSYTQILIGALFTKAKRWKQPKCPSE